jgi:tripartite-type tricarboxylate transporter receptor subunit TctC
MSLTRTAGAVAVLAIGLCASSAHAQDYPARSVEFVVPFAPGGGADASQRAFNTFAEPLVGKPLVVVNKPGAGGATGWAEMVRAKPDGYTLSVTTPPFNILPALVKPKQTGYKLDQFTNICIYAIVPDVLVVKEGSPFTDLKSFVDHAKQNPKKVKAANTGTLGADFMTTLMIEDATGTEMTQIPFNSGALALQGTLAGTTDAMVASALYAVAQKGNLRTLAIATENRHPLVPDVPTFREAGFDVVSERYRVLSGPPGMSQELVNYWANICKQVTDNPKFREEMDKLGQPAAYKDPAETRRLLDGLTTSLQALVTKYKLAE